MFCSEQLQVPKRSGALNKKEKVETRAGTHRHTDARVISITFMSQAVRVCEPCNV